MEEFLKDLFVYSHAHDQKLISLFEKHPGMLDGKAGDLFDHILNAHHIWNQRMFGKEHRFGVWERHSAAEQSKIAIENHKDSLHLMENTSLDEILAYKDTRGKSFRNTIKDILFHIVNHGTYHRGQIALEFRNSGVDPVISDFIYYKRN